MQTDYVYIRFTFSSHPTALSTVSLSITVKKLLELPFTVKGPSSDLLTAYPYSEFLFTCSVLSPTPRQEKCYSKMFNELMTSCVSKQFSLRCPPEESTLMNVTFTYALIKERVP